MVPLSVMAVAGLLATGEARAGGAQAGGAWVGAGLELAIPTGDHLLADGDSAAALGPAVRQVSATAAGPLRPSLAPRLSLGALVLGGHADVHLSTAPAALRLGALPAGVSGGGLRAGTEAGLRVFPLALDGDGLRPFVGVAWLATRVGQVTAAEGAGPWLPQHRVRPSLGGAWQQGPHRVDLRVAWAPGRSQRYPVSTVLDGELESDLWTVGVDYRVDLDGALGRESKGGGAGPVRLELGAGAVAAHAVGTTWASPEGGDTGAFLGEQPAGAAAPSVALGVGWTKPGVVLRVDWRAVSQRTVAYGATRSWQRQAVSLDGIKMLGNGLVVTFLGVGASLEILDFAEEQDGRVTLAADGVQLAPTVLSGLDLGVRGWADWRLRPSLRYTPGPALEPAGSPGNLDFQQLELGAQLVYRPRLSG